MALPIIKCTPDRGGYKVDRGSSVLSVLLNGGQGRYRADQLGASSKVSVTFTLDVAGYNYIMAFFRTTLSEGSLPFQISLISEDSNLDDYQAYFMADENKSGISLISQSGLTYVVGATLEVVPLTPTDPIADAAIVADYVAPTV
jgi:hypothetical protein